MDCHRGRWVSVEVKLMEQHALREFVHDDGDFAFPFIPISFNKYACMACIGCKGIRIPITRPDNFTVLEKT